MPFFIASKHPTAYNFCIHVLFTRFKLIKWWIQSFLVGIPEIICGYRDDDGVVHRLESLQTHRIPDMVKVSLML